MDIPKINKSDRKREYELYSYEQRANIVYSYLFQGLSHRKLDSEILGLDSDYSKGYQSMGTLHYMGLRNDFKGIFEGIKLEDAIEELKSKKDNSYDFIISILEYFLMDETIEQDLSFENAEEYEILKEGQKKIIYTTKYERSSKLRKQAIIIHGTTCMACGFNYEDFYGDYGKDYIEVHHIKPLSQNSEEVEINPEKDLIVLCANCHRMIHRKRNNVLTLDELKNLINK